TAGGSRPAAAALAAAATALTSLLLTLSPASAATTFVQGRETTDKGARVGQLTVSFDIASGPSGGTVGGGFFVIDGLLTGSRDRVRIAGGGVIADVSGPTFYAGTSPILEQEERVVEFASLTRWA